MSMLKTFKVINHEKLCARKFPTIRYFLALAIIYQSHLSNKLLDGGQVALYGRHMKQCLAFLVFLKELGLKSENCNDK